MKKKLLIIPTLLLAVLGLVSCGDEKKETPVEDNKTVYISPTGTSANKGTEESPLDIISAFSNVEKGTTIKVLPGRYMVPRRITTYKSGDAHNYINVVNESNEAAIFDFSVQSFDSLNRGIELNGNYWHFNNIEIVNAGDNGMYIGGSHNIIENCLFHENRDTGLQLGRASGSYADISEWPSYNLIKNCTSYNNYDDETFGENADGFAAKLTVGYGNVFDGCIAYRNSDDGWDLFAKVDSGNIGTVFLYNCVSFENGFLMEKANESGVERFITRDGDGIGFKLGGSTMKGDVVLENCVAFNNRLHGIGDNSNPGVISVNNCTTYNNCAAIDENGKVIAPENTSSASNEAESSNFDLARDENSYNNYTNLLSYVTNKTAQPDRYIGAAENSVFYAGGNKYYKIDKNIDASCLYSDKKGELFELTSESFVSLEAPNGLANTTIHKTMRNADASVQLGSFLSLVPGEFKNSNIGADLTKTKYEDYNHFEPTEIPENLTEDEISVISAYDSLRVNCNSKAVYQNFLAPSNYANCEIYWISSDPSVVSIGDTISSSVSGTKEITISVNRQNVDKTVTLKAEIECGSYSKTKEFVLNVVADKPGIGKMYVNNVVDNKIIMNQYERFYEPSLIVTNSADYSGKALDKSLYDLTTSYIYQETKNSKAYEVNGVYTSKAGVYTVTHKVSLKNNASDTNEYSYQVFVCNPSFEVDFAKEIELYVNRDGVNIFAEMDYPLGKVYVLTSKNATVTKEDIITNGKMFEFFDDIVSFNVECSNEAAYYVHTIVENNAKTHTSDIYTNAIVLNTISTTNDLYKLFTNTTNSTTIYSLTTDLDFTGFNWQTTSASFKGLLNGNGHKLTNISTSAPALIYKVSEGTIMNLNFENIVINSEGKDAQKSGIIGTMSGGYVHNVKVTNIDLKGSDRVGAIAGQVGVGKNYFTSISVINDENHIISGSRSAGLIGFIQDESQATELEVEIKNCVVKSNIGKDGDQYVGGFIGRFDNRQSFMTLNIDKVYYEGKIIAKTYAGGILGGYNYGHSLITISNSISDFECEYNKTPFTIALKNCSPIIGRNTSRINGGITYVINCYATYSEYNTDYGSTAEYFNASITDKEFIKNTLGFDLENIWNFDDNSKTLTLK